MRVTILETRPGKWRLRIEEPRVDDGARQFSYRTISGTREDAEQVRLDILRERRADEGSGVARKRQPKGAAALGFGEYLKRWVERRMHRGEITTSTGEHYEMILNYIVPRLGKRPLQSITADDVQTVYDDLLTRLSPRTVRHLHARLKTAFDDAVVEGLIETDPISGKKVRPPRIEETKTETLSQADVAKLVACCDVQHPAVAPLVRFAVGTGMRRGEICALRWQDVEFRREGGVLKAWAHVRHSAVQQGSGAVLAPPKTKAGRRTIALPPSTTAELHTARKEVVRALGRSDIDELHVFPASHGGMRSPGALTHGVNLALKACGLDRFTLHDLRHAHATHLLRNRMPPKAVAERLGHADVMITMRTYQHVIPQDDAALALLTEDLLSAPKADTEADDLVSRSNDDDDEE